MTFGSRLRMRGRKSTTTENLWPDATDGPVATADTDVIAIGDAPSRQRVRVKGKVKAVRVQPLAGVAGIRATVVDDTDQLTIVFVGRRQVAGIEPGRKLLAEGVIVEQYGKRVMLNPVYRLL
jgi:hypothetical protein